MNFFYCDTNRYAPCAIPDVTPTAPAEYVSNWDAPVGLAVTGGDWVPIIVIAIILIVVGWWANHYANR